VIAQMLHARAAARVRAWVRAGNAAQQMCVVEGPPGCGKSTLVQTATAGVPVRVVTARDVHVFSEHWISRAPSRTKKRKSDADSPVSVGAGSTTAVAHAYAMRVLTAPEAKRAGAAAVSLVGARRARNEAPQANQACIVVVDDAHQLPTLVTALIELIAEPRAIPAAAEAPLLRVMFVTDAPAPDLAQKRGAMHVALSPLEPDAITRVLTDRAAAGGARAFVGSSLDLASIVARCGSNLHMCCETLDLEIQSLKLRAGILRAAALSDALHAEFGACDDFARAYIAHCGAASTIESVCDTVDWLRSSGRLLGARVTRGETVKLCAVYRTGAGASLTHVLRHYMRQGCSLQHAPSLLSGDPARSPHGYFPLATAGDDGELLAAEIVGSTAPPAARARRRPRATGRMSLDERVHRGGNLGASRLASTLRDQLPPTFRHCPDDIATLRIFAAATHDLSLAAAYACVPWEDASHRSRDEIAAGLATRRLARWTPARHAGCSDACLSGEVKTSGLALVRAPPAEFKPGEANLAWHAMRTAHGATWDQVGAFMSTDELLDRRGVVGQIGELIYGDTFKSALSRHIATLSGRDAMAIACPIDSAGRRPFRHYDDYALHAGAPARRRKGAPDRDLRTLVGPTAIARHEAASLSSDLDALFNDALASGHLSDSPAVIAPVPAPDRDIHRLVAPMATARPDLDALFNDALASGQLSDASTTSLAATSLSSS
jgi:hypothetical protein